MRRENPNRFQRSSKILTTLNIYIFIYLFYYFMIYFFTKFWALQRPSATPRVWSRRAGPHQPPTLRLRTRPRQEPASSRQPPLHSRPRPFLLALWCSRVRFFSSHVLLHSSSLNAINGMTPTDLSSPSSSINWTSSPLSLPARAPPLTPSSFSPSPPELTAIAVVDRSGSSTSCLAGDVPEPHPSLADPVVPSLRLVARSSPFAVVRSPKVEDNPLIYFLKHVSNFWSTVVILRQCYSCVRFWRFWCIAKIEHRDNAFEHVYDFIILKMITATIHHLSDFHTRKRLQIWYRFSVWNDNC
jgi:hypothetical protein